MSRGIPSPTNRGCGSCGHRAGRVDRKDSTAWSSCCHGFRLWQVVVQASPLLQETGVPAISLLQRSEQNARALGPPPAVRPACWQVTAEGTDVAGWGLSFLTGRRNHPAMLWCCGGFGWEVALF